MADEQPLENEPQPKSRRFKVAEAERFVIRDAKGRERGHFGVDAAGSTSLEITDKRGRAAAVVKVWNNGENEIVLRDVQGNARVNIGLTEAGAGFSLVDERKTIRASLELLPEGVTQLQLFDEQGKPRSSIKVWKDGESETVLRDAAGTPRATMSASEEGSSLSLADGDQRVRASLEIGADGVVRLLLFDEDGDPVYQKP